MTKIAPPIAATPSPSSNGSTLSSVVQANVARANAAGVPPLTYLGKLKIPDDRLVMWRDALAEMRPAELPVIAELTSKYLDLWQFGNVDRKAFTGRVIGSIRNWECRELEIIEAFEQLLRNEKRTRDEIGYVVIEKLRDNPSWHPSWDQIIDAIEAAQKKFTSCLGRLNRLVKEAEERALGLRHTPGETLAIEAVRNRLSDAEKHALDWQAYLADRPARRAAFVVQYRRDRDAAAQQVNDAAAALRYFTGKPGEAEARRQLANRQAEYDVAEAALKASEANLATALAQPPQLLEAPSKLIGRPQ